MCMSITYSISRCTAEGIISFKILQTYQCIPFVCTIVCFSEVYAIYDRHSNEPQCTQTQHTSGNIYGS